MGNDRNRLQQIENQEGKEMRVILLNGSPHKEGSTHTALAEVAKGLQAQGIDTKEIWIGNKPVGGCTACGACGKLGKCAYDDLVNEIIAELDDCDGLVVGSPVYYASPNGSLIGLMDRLFYAASSKLAFKPGACVTAARRAGTTASLDALNKYFLFNNMPLVSSRYWNMVHGGNATDVCQDEEGMQVMRQLGLNMGWLIRCIENGRNNGIHKPEQENKIWTNYIR